MDRIRIVGGKPLNGTIPISGAKNATLPLMIASLLTDDVLVLENVPRLADVDAAAAHPEQSRRRHHGEGQAPGRRGASRPDAAHLRRAHRRHHRALRARLQDARELLGGRAAARPHGRGEGVAAGRLRHRHAAGRPADHGAGAARRHDRDRRRLCDRARQGRTEGRRDRISQGDGRRHAHGADGGLARERRDRDRERRARARGGRRRRVPDQDGREDLRRRHLAHRGAGRVAAQRRAPFACCPTGSRPAPTRWRSR